MHFEETKTVKLFYTEKKIFRTIKLMADFDPVSNSLLNNGNNKIKYLIWKVWNELIHLLSTEILNILSNEIRTSIYYSIIMDYAKMLWKCIR